MYKYNVYLIYVAKFLQSNSYAHKIIYIQYMYVTRTSLVPYTRLIVIELAEMTRVAAFKSPSRSTNS